MTDRTREAPSRIGDVVARVLARAGVGPRIAQAQVIPEWAERVGPQIAAVTVPERVTPDGTLFVGVRTNAWMTELQLSTPAIMAKLNAGRGPGRISGIRWFLAP